MWLYVPALGKELPHEFEATCKVIQVNETLVKTGAPDQIFVDCGKKIGWLKSGHPTKFWTVYGEDGCYE